MLKPLICIYTEIPIKFWTIQAVKIWYYILIKP